MTPITAATSLRTNRRNAAQVITAETMTVLGDHVGIDHLPVADIRQTVTIELGTPVHALAATRWPLAWQPCGYRTTLPAFSGSLEVADAVNGGTTLRVTGAYRPPLGLLGSIVDKVVGRRMAELTIEDFVSGIARRLDQAARFPARRG